MFYFIKETRIANYADDNTIYTVEGNKLDLLKTLENETSVILNWFRVNVMKSNDDKCQDSVCVTLGKETIKNSNSVELLGIKIDAKLNFTEHVTDLCKKG